jgi:hypothetical protein
MLTLSSLEFTTVGEISPTLLTARMEMLYPFFLQHEFGTAMYFLCPVTDFIADLYEYKKNILRVAINITDSAWKNVITEVAAQGKSYV